MLSAKVRKDLRHGVTSRARPLFYARRMTRRGAPRRAFALALICCAAVPASVETEPEPAATLARVRVKLERLERENAALRARWAASSRRPAAVVGSAGLRRRAQAGTGAPSVPSVPEVPSVPDVPDMPNVSMPEVPAVPTLQDFLPPPPPCPDPANCDCFGAWSICSAACETAAERVWTLGRPATGSGVACPPATNCGMFGLQDGECAARPYNASACFDKDGNPCPPPPVGFAATIVRLLPMASAMFVAYFGTRISTMVRVFSVFWASAAPTLIPTMMQIKQEGSLSAATFVGIGGAFYAGGLGSFAAVKKREFGIMVQGVALGYIVTSIAQGYVLGAILEAAPGAKAYLEWITMVFTFSVGGAIGKFSQKYEDIVSVAATAVMGAYAQLQTFASL